MFIDISLILIFAEALGLYGLIVSLIFHVHQIKKGLHYDIKLLNN